MGREQFRCVNFGKCSTADRGARIDPSDPRRPRCPNCGEPLTSSGAATTRTLTLWIPGAVVLLIVAALSAGFWLRTRKVADGSRNGVPVGDFRVGGGDSWAPRPDVVFSDRLVVRLSEAAISGDAAGVREAIAAGASVNTRGRDGLTPLHLALLHFQPAGFEALLANGANPNIPADNGDSIMSLAAVMPETIWLESALAHGGQVEIRDRRDRTPLMLAASRGRTGNVRLLLSSQADANARDDHGDTALIHTFQALAPKGEIAHALLESGGRPDESDLAGFSARDYAASYGDPTLLAVFPERR